MQFFSKIMSKIFGHSSEATAIAAAATPAPAAQSAATAKGPTATSASSVPPVEEASPVPASSPKALPVVDVAAVLDDLAAGTKEKLDWRRSIVDLMKLVGIDSSLPPARSWRASWAIREIPETLRR